MSAPAESAVDADDADDADDAEVDVAESGVAEAGAWKGAVDGELGVPDCARAGPA